MSNDTILRSFTKDKLKVNVYNSRKAMGDAAGSDIAEAMRTLLAERDTINMIFAAAPSQNETLAALVAEPGIDWSRVNAFHMDEYIGLPEGAPQAFSNYLREHIFNLVPFKSVNCINAASTAEDECARYSALLREYPVDIVCLGIGENGHIAFNDPWVADFNDPVLVKAVPLDEVCRNQQVNDGCFAKVDDVPKSALSLTIPALTSAKYMFCSVPAATKAQAVERTVNEEITTECPATIMRNHPAAIMYCDPDSGAALLQ